MKPTRRLSIFKNRRGTFVEEYAVLIMAIVAASVLMNSYVRDSIRGMVRWVEILCNTMGGGA